MRNQKQKLKKIPKLLDCHKLLEVFWEFSLFLTFFDRREQLSMHVVVLMHFPYEAIDLSGLAWLPRCRNDHYFVTLHSICLLTYQ